MDTNILVYAQKSNHQYLLEEISQQDFTISAITKLEALGFHKIIKSEKQNLQILIENILVWPMDNKIIDRAISLRQSRSMSLGDSIVAATALEHRLQLWTNNLKDFRHISDLDLYNPVKLDK